MKNFKRALILILCVFLTSSLYTQTLKITKPNGGETWPLGSIQKISWERSGITSGNIKLTLVKGESEIGVIANDFYHGYNYYSWKVGELFFGVPVPEPGSDYKIRVRWQGKILMDFSNHFFSITPKGGEVDLLKVVSPNGGEIWKRGDVKNIVWDPKSINSGKYKLLLYKGDQPVGVIARDIPYPESTFAWTVGNLETESGIFMSKDYRVKVVLQGQNKGDISDQTMEIHELKSITSVVNPKFNSKISISYPRNGENLKLDNDIQIKWNSVDLPVETKLTLELYQGDVKKGLIVRNLPASQNTFNWKAGTLLENKKVTSGVNYLIKIIIEDGSSFTKSEFFKIID